LDDFEDTVASVEKAWWASKKLIVAMAHIVLSTIGAFTAMLVDHSTIPTVFSSWLASLTAVAVGHNAIQGRQDNTAAANPAPPVVVAVKPPPPTQQAQQAPHTQPEPAPPDASAVGTTTPSPPPPPPQHSA
jgi:hypothetical protein